MLSSLLMSLLALPAGLGADTTAHLLPFQWSTSLRSTMPSAWVLPYRPAAQQLAEDEQKTPKSSLPSPVRLPPGAGVGTTDHFVPFQCKAWLRMAPSPDW